MDLVPPDDVSGPPSIIKDGGPAVEHPKEPNFVTLKQFAERANMNISTVRNYVRNGRIESKQHPHFDHPYRVIPTRVLHRAQMTRIGLHVPYHGREYPHQFYLYYCLASYGNRRDLLTDDLKLYGFEVPRELELVAMEEAIFTTAPKLIRRRRDAGVRYNTLVEFEDWMEHLGFQELYEDPIGFLPPGLLNSKRIRFLLEIMASAGMKPHVMSENIFNITDMHVEPRVIRNYLMMFFYIRAMEEVDWLDYLADVRGANPQEAKIRADCCDSKVELYKYLGLTGDLSFREEVEKCFWMATALYQDWASSNDFIKQAASPTHARVMMQVLHGMNQLMEKEEERSKKLEDRRKASGAGDLKDNTKEKSEEDNDPIFREEVESGNINSGEEDDDGQASIPSA